jgi:hypothetical protein
MDDRWREGVVILTLWRTGFEMWVVLGGNRRGTMVEFRLVGVRPAHGDHLDIMAGGRMVSLTGHPHMAAGSPRKSALRTGAELVLPANSGPSDW